MLAAGALAALALASAGCEGEGCGLPGDGWLGYITRRDGSYDVRLVRGDGTCDRTFAAGAGPELAPSLSARGSVAVYWTMQDGAGRIVMRDLHVGLERVLELPGIPIVEEPEVSPDGTLIAFEGIIPPARGDLYVVPTWGGEPVAVAPATSDDATPAWSADGGSLFFVSDRSGSLQVWRVNLDGSGLEQVSTDETAALTCGASACGVQGKPSPSPDGRQVAFTRATPAQQGTVVVRDLESGAERVLAADVPCAEPSWSPDGRSIAMFDLSFGDPEIVVRDAAAGVLLHRITASPGIDGAPSWAR